MFQPRIVPNLGPRGPKRPSKNLVVAAICLVLVSISLWHILSVHRWPSGVDFIWRGLKITVSGFVHPEISRDILQDGWRLTLQTLATALLGSALGIGLGLGIGLLSTRNLMVGIAPPSSIRRQGYDALNIRRVICELARLFQDLLRAVPDFAWALLILTIPGPGPVTGILALGLGMGGILGKIYSELWDSVDSQRMAFLVDSGASRVSVFLYGIAPISARSVLSYTLMRIECTVRNASVIGVVGGGGLGGQIVESFGLGETRRVATFLLFVLILTVSVDLISNAVRNVLRQDANGGRFLARNLRGMIYRRIATLGFVGVALLSSLLAVWGDLERAWKECRRVEWTWIGNELSKLLRPEWSWKSWGQAGFATVLPLSLAVVATILSMIAAIGFAWFGSMTFQGVASTICAEKTSMNRRIIRGAGLIVSRAMAVGFRAVPEVAWVLIFASILRMGPFAALLALVLHSTGILARLYVETIDNLPHNRLEASFTGSRSTTFLYAALPVCWSDLLTYAFFQFESNLRAGLVLGIVGAGGLGDLFHSSLSYWNLHRASTFLLAMVILTTIVDRCARRLHLARVRSNR